MGAPNYPVIRYLRAGDGNPQPVRDDLGLPVRIVGGTGGADYEVVVVTYIVNTAFTGASVGDTITMTQVLELDATPTTVATIWRNQTTATDLSTVPSAVNLTMVGAGGATEATLALVNAGIGAPSDAQATADTGNWSNNSMLKRIGSLLANRLATLGVKTASGSSSVVPASDANVGRELYTVTSISVSTPAAGGSGFATFPSQACTALEIINTRSDAFDIEYNRGSGPSVPIPAGYTRLIDGITNANQIGIRRRDQAATAVPVVAEARAVA